MPIRTTSPKTLSSYANRRKKERAGARRSRMRNLRSRAARASSPPELLGREPEGRDRAGRVDQGLERGRVARLGARLLGERGRERARQGGDARDGPLDRGSVLADLREHRLQHPRRALPGGDVLVLERGGERLRLLDRLAERLGPLAQDLERGLAPFSDELRDQGIH